MADRRASQFGREEILSRQPARSDRPAHASRHHQGAMDLRTGPSAAERGTRAGSLRGTILARPSSSRTHDNDRLRVPPASPTRTSGAEKKESTGLHLSRACRPYAKPSSNSSFNHDRSNARTAEDKSAKSSSVNKICQSSARLQTQLDHQVMKAAMLTAASKFRASLSYLVAIRRQSFSLQNMRSMRFRSL